MTKKAIHVQGLSKIYTLGEVSTGTLSQDIQRWFSRKLGLGDPYIRVGEENIRDSKGGDVVYSLKDVSFDVNQGDAVGIIGRNGAGKSTLIKLLSRVTSPTQGKISIKGRIASLLEVGTGFHPELTGRENIFLNGAILGMRKREIERKFDAIVEFSGVERYIDTPVKRYSSGMYVRLAFAVAAHLESEILVVDEVLAVGDTEFQKKCIGKMNDVSKADGRTILFVSHQMSSIKALCNKGLYLRNGRILHSGEITEVIDKYYETDSTQKLLGEIPKSISRLGSGRAIFTRMELLDEKYFLTTEVGYKEKLRLRIKFEVFEDIKNVFLDVRVSSLDGITISQSSNVLDQGEFYELKEGKYTVTVQIDNNFQPGNYFISIGLHVATYWTDTLDFIERVFDFSVSKVTRDNQEADYAISIVQGYVRPYAEWQLVLD